MERIIWICMIIDVIAGILLIIVSNRSDQDAAGKSMMALPVLALIGLPLLGYLLLRSDYKVFALIITGLPAIIVVFVIVTTISQSRNK